MNSDMARENKQENLDPKGEFVSSGADSPIDLTLDGDSFEDLQALADEAAQAAPEYRGKPTQQEMMEGSDPVVAAMQQELKEAAARIQELEKREAENLDKHHRLLADFANSRNRIARDIQMAVDQSEKKLLMELLPVIDNFERCMASNYSTIEDFRNGVALIHKQFLDSLRRVGVEEIPLSVGDPFDAQTAEALTTMENPELPDGAVASIFERGFLLRSQLLRAARVVVNRQG